MTRAAHRVTISQAQRAYARILAALDPRKAAHVHGDLLDLNAVIHLAIGAGLLTGENPAAPAEQGLLLGED